jgi:transcriptional regulator with PAS, ATPase and Fis domain
MKAIKLLAIAPYEGLKTLLQKIASQRDDVELTIYVADMFKGVEVVKSMPLERYSAIISRAGTAGLIEKEVSIPVIDVGITIYDMLRAIRMAQSYNGKYAVVGFPMITKYANIINELLQYQTDVYTVNSTQEIETCLSQLKETGYSLVAGDVITVNSAKQIGLNTILITSGFESVEEALNRGVKWCRDNSALQTQNRILKSVFTNFKIGTAVFDKDRSLLYQCSTLAASEQDQIHFELASLADKVIDEGKIRIAKRIGKWFFHINGEVINYDGKESILFCYKFRACLTKAEDQIVKYSNINNTPTVNLETFKTCSPVMQRVIDFAKKYSMTNLPIVILGQPGCGKDTFAYIIYRDSEYHNNPMITIDCASLSEKQLAFLLKSERSPLCESSCTLYFKNIHFLSEVHQNALIAYFKNTDIHNRNRLIFSCAQDLCQQGSLIDFAVNRINALTICIPTLNERIEDIQNLATLYLNEINSEIGKQVIGFYPEAILALQKFQWKYNLDQFKRVVKELVVLTDSAYISEDLTLEVLSRESDLKENEEISAINLDGSLDEITKSVIESVLKKENMNQTKAAKRLGISRSTLWKKIKSDNK